MRILRYYLIIFVALVSGCTTITADDVAKDLASGGTKLISKWIEDGKSINSKSEDGVPFVYVSILNHNIKGTKLILDSNQELNTPYPFGNLFAYSVSNNICSRSIVDFYLDYGHSINSQDSVSGGSVLSWAVFYNNEECVRYLLEKGADINLQDQSGSTAVLTSVLVDNENIVKLLIRNGADVNTQNNLGITPLMMAFQVNDVDLISILFENGAEPCLTDKKDRVAIEFSSKEAVRKIYEKEFLACENRQA